MVDGKLKIKDLIDGYGRHPKGRGPCANKGKLVVCPDYKASLEFNREQKHALIDDIRCSRSIGQLSFLDNKNGTYDLIDGEQRILTICEFLTSKFTYYDRFFHQLEKEEYDVILNYELNVNVISI